MKLEIYKNSQSIFIALIDGDCDLVKEVNIIEAEQIWQQLMQVCHDYRRNEQIERVNN